MTEYRIVAKVDPQTAAGSQKVKQDLRGIQTEAVTTTGRLDQIDKKIGDVGRTAAAASKNFDRSTASIERMTAAEFRAAGGLDGLNKSSGNAAKGQASLDAALRRVLQATDSEAAEQMRLNALLVDAKRLLDAGTISAERYAQVQKLAAGQGKELNVVTGSQRIGMQQLGFQLGDVATMYSLGAKPAQIFGSQIGQVSQALMLMGGNNGSLLSKVAGFLGGPWGIALTVATILLGPFLGKLLESNDALADSIEKLKKDAAETETNRIAKERYLHTEEGLAAAVRDRIAAQDEAIKKSRTQGEQDNLLAQSAQNAANATREQTKTLLEHAIAQERIANQTTFGAAGGAGAGAAQVAYAGRVDVLQKALDKVNKDIADTGILFQRSLVELATEAAKTAADPVEKIKQHYEGPGGIIASIQAAANNDKELTTSREKQLDLTRRLTAEYEKERKEIEAAQKAQRTVNDGVSRFISAQQAIGIAGRELQQAGFRVSENSQFGGVTPGVHSGAGHAQDRAVDINFGSGVIEANVPDIRAQLDGMAKRYAARGYIVLWNGQRYDPSGKVTAIPGGQDQHHDHMHLEAPVAIVGKPTQAGTEEAIRREDEAAQKAANLVREKSDFVGAIIDQQSMRGLEAGPESLQARMDKVVGEYKRRFNTDTMSEADQKKIRDAIIGGDERVVQQQFYETYGKPLERLKALQGTTGLDRKILNAQLEESVRQFGPLTEGYNLLSEAENKAIDSNIRHGDQLTREAQILEEVRGPLENYKATIAALNDLLAKGTITQTSYNARVAELGNAATQSALNGLTGVDPQSGQNYEDVAAISNENARYASQLEALDNFRQMKLDLGISYDALELAAAQQHQQNLAKIDQARQDVALAAAEQIASGVTSAMKSMFGEQSKMYKAAFAIEKAVAIARAIVAIQTGIAQAAALPFPANLPAIASVVAATASIISNIQAVALNFRDGGYVSGPGGPRDDRVPIMASNGEFVMNAPATARFRPLLEQMNAGGGMMMRADGGPVTDTAAGAAPGATPAPGAATPPLTPEAMQLATLQRIAVAVEAMRKDIHQMAHPSTKDRLLDVASILSPGLGGIANALFGHADGGWTGDEATHRRTGYVHGQEFVVKAPYAQRNRSLLEAVNAGRDARRASQAHAAESARVVAMQAPAINVTTPPAEVRIVNVTDPRAALQALKTSEGVETIMNIIETHPNEFKRLLGTA